MNLAKRCGVCCIQSMMADEACPKCECPHWRVEASRAADAYSPWKDADGTWYNGPAREVIARICAHCGWKHVIRKARGKTVSVDSG